MKTRIEAIERAKEFAFQHGSVSVVARCLEEEGFGGLLDRSDIEAIVTETEFIRGMLPESPNKLMPRIIGVIAVIMGVAAMSLGGMPSARGYSPAGYGLPALILGIILIVKPSAGKA